MSELNITPQEEKSKGLDGSEASPAETKVLPRFPGYRSLEVGEIVEDGDFYCHPSWIFSDRKPAVFVSSPVSDGWEEHYFRRIDPAPQAPAAPEGSSPKAPADPRPQTVLYNDLLVVWRDNGECLITTRKYPDDTGVNGPQCWPKGISGNYLATHCRAPIFHRSALDALGVSTLGEARKALEFYANGRGWLTTGNAPGPVAQDSGRVARAALAILDGKAMGGERG